MLIAHQNTAPLPILHSAQATVRFDLSVEPPRARGITWSICNTTMGAFRPQYWQVKLYLDKSSNLSRVLRTLLYDCLVLVIFDSDQWRYAQVPRFRQLPQRCCIAPTGKKRSPQLLHIFQGWTGLSSLISRRVNRGMRVLKTIIPADEVTIRQRISMRYLLITLIITYGSFQLGRFP